MFTCYRLGNPINIDGFKKKFNKANMKGKGKAKLSSRDLKTPGCFSVNSLSFWLQASTSFISSATRFASTQQFEVWSWHLQQVWSLYIYCYLDLAFVVVCLNSNRRIFGKQLHRWNRWDGGAGRVNKQHVWVRYESMNQTSNSNNEFATKKLSSSLLDLWDLAVETSRKITCKEHARCLNIKILYIHQTYL